LLDQSKHIFPMRHFYSKGKTNLFHFLVTGIFAATAFTNSVNAQTPQVRSYATRQVTREAGLDALGSFSNEALAVDADPSTHSNITLGVSALGAYKEQVIDFNPSPSATGSYATMIPGSKPITVKVTVPAGLASALSGLEIQAITNLQRTGSGTILSPYVWQYTNVGPVYSSTSLLGLVAGAGEVEITITPGVDYQGIRVRLNGGIASAAIGVDIYDVYVKNDATSAVACAQPIDVLSGVRAGAISLANATGSVTNAWNSIDNGSSGATTYAQLNTGVQVLSEVYHTVIFNTPSKVGDSVRLVIQDVGGLLLDLGLLNGLAIRLYNGSSTTPVQVIDNTSNILSLRLLNPNGNIAELVAATSAVFDRVEIKLGGVAGAFSSLRVYDVSRKPGGLNLASSNYSVYAGQSVTLNASTSNGDNLAWYDAATAGNVVSNVVTTTAAQAGTTLTYYVGTSRSGCTETSERKPVTVDVIGFTTTTPATAYLNTAYTSSVAITPQASPNLPNTPVYNYALVSGTLPNLTLNSTTGAITGTPNATGTFPIGVGVDDVANTLPVGTFNYNVIVNNVPLPVGMTEFTAGLAAAGVDLKWSTASEKNNAGFAIERSTDGKSFVKIGYQRSKAEGGTSASVLEYSFTDTDPANGINYYRLKQTDLDGTSVYTNIVNVLVRRSDNVTVFPNPAKDMITVKATDVKSIEIYSLTGQRIEIPVTYGATACRLGISTLANGNYTLKVVTAKGVDTYKLAVQH